MDWLPNEMDLRDYFAGIALRGLLENQYRRDTPDTPIGLAVEAYQIADAMIAERDATRPTPLSAGDEFV